MRLIAVKVKSITGFISQTFLDTIYNSTDSQDNNQSTNQVKTKVGVVEDFVPILFALGPIDNY